MPLNYLFSVYSFCIFFVSHFSPLFFSFLWITFILNYLQYLRIFFLQFLKNVLVSLEIMRHTYSLSLFTINILLVQGIQKSFLLSIFYDTVVFNITFRYI